MEKENHCYCTVLNSINEGVIMTNSKGCVTLYNKQIQKFEGLDPANVIGRHLTEVYNITEETSDQLSVWKSKKPIIDRYQKFLTADNKELNSIGSTYPVFKNGEIVAAFTICRNLTKIHELLNKTMQAQEKSTENTLVEDLGNNTRFQLNDIVAKSDVMLELLEKARKAALVDATVLVWGETGTGKELVVQGIHNENPLTRKNPFVAVNCAAIPESLLESLLFGTTKGSFTGSVESTGLFEQAGKGTLYLDEINSMPLNLQAKLLRVLQEKKFRKLGGKEELPMQCRITSSTNVDPAECVATNTLRKDLYYRLSVLVLEIPPLVKRREDIPLLINHFINSLSAKYGKRVNRISFDLVSAFCDYTWPGNVRELEHSIESAVSMIDEEGILLPEHFPSNLLGKLEKPLFVPSKLPPNGLSGVLSQTEKETICQVLEECGWNISESARVLKIGRTNLQYRMKKNGIKQPLIIK
ncbi:hypothetical protein DCMF_26405 [Candidatus Formimonas warabiya]|uniref:PAS domain S-box protein n=1 Tax=Formimonas warabiya TaxID=1761012 RepID=A0A3G1L2Q7_FORW1|nr:hypothetical protein DCMF_26405 [Candidatus Formimonas warabiya]